MSQSSKDVSNNYIFFYKQIEKNLIRALRYGSALFAYVLFMGV